MRFEAFRALRYDPDVAGPAAETSAPPYDALDPLRYTEHRVANPYTVLELIAGGGRAALDRWLRTGVLVEDGRPALYLYEEHELRHGRPAVQSGLVGVVDLDDVDDGSLLLHEHVEPGRAAERAERLRGVPVDVTPVTALLAQDDGALDAPVRRARMRPPLVAFTDEASIDHRIWRVDEAAEVAAATAALAGATAVLADGHHRIAAARRLREERRAAGLPPGGWGKVLTWLVGVAGAGPELRAVHRLVPGTPPTDERGAPAIPGFSALPWHEGTQGLAAALQMSPTMAVGLVTPEGCWVLRPTLERRLRAEASAEPPLQALDAQVVAAAVIPPISGDRPAQAVFDVEEAAARVRRGGQSLLLLRPPTAAQVVDVASAGLRMPAKTTWFRPKPRAGLLMRRVVE